MQQHARSTLHVVHNADEELMYWRERRAIERRRRLSRRAARRHMWAGALAFVFIVFAVLYLLIHVLVAVLS